MTSNFGRIVGPTSKAVVGVSLALIHSLAKGAADARFGGHRIETLACQAAIRLTFFIHAANGPPQRQVSYAVEYPIDPVV